MNERVKELWIEALTSGKYTQAQGALHRQAGDGYCCLGVLCDLHGLDTGKGSWRLYSVEDDGEAEINRKYHYTIEGPSAAAHESDSFLPPEVIKWAELENEDPFVGDDDEDEEIRDDRTLSSLNDSGFTFKQIAALIRGQL